MPVKWRARYQAFMNKSMPYFLIFMVVDLYFLKNVFGFLLSGQLFLRFFLVEDGYPCGSINMRSPIKIL